MYTWGLSRQILRVRYQREDKCTPGHTHLLHINRHVSDQVSRAVPKELLAAHKARAEKLRHIIIGGHITQFWVFVGIVFFRVCVCVFCQRPALM